MTTVTCHNCHRENPAGKGFCQFCGSRLSPPPPEPDNVEPDELRRLREALQGSERAAAAAKLELEVVRRDMIAAKEELKALTASHESKEGLAEEARLRDSLVASEKNLAALQLELDAARARLGSNENQLKEHLATSERAIASLKRELDAAGEDAVAELNEKLAAGEDAMASLKQEHASTIAKVAEAHQEKIAQKDTFIDELKAKLHGFAESGEKLVAGEKAMATLKQEHASTLAKAAEDHQKKIAQKDTFIEELKAKLQGFAEQKIAPAAGLASTSNGSGQQGDTNRRSFGITAMSIVAMLFAGAGGLGGYLYHGDDASSRNDGQATVRDLQAKLAELGKLNRDLQDGLRSQREAYQRVSDDLKRAEDQLRTKTTANADPGSGVELQRQLTDARAANQQLQQKLTASETELVQRRQDVATKDQTIEQLTRQLQEAKAQEDQSQDSKEAKPRSRLGTDLDTTIRNLEREYGIPRIGR
jgi:chromosome segregation ATPase